MRNPFRRKYRPENDTINVRVRVNGNLTETLEAASGHDIDINLDAQIRVTYPVFVDPPKRK